MATDLVEVDEWTATVTVPEDGDDYDAASVELPLQAVTNRTVNLSSKIDAVPDKPHTWTDDNAFAAGLALSGAGNELAYLPAPRVRTIILPQTLACPRFGSTDVKLAGAGTSSPFGWMWTSAGEDLLYMFRLPDGAVLQRVRVAITAAGGKDVTVKCYQLEATVESIVAGNAVHDLGSTTVTIAMNDLITHVIPTPLVTNGKWHTYVIDILSMAVGSSCAFVEIEFLDPGPRNF